MSVRHNITVYSLVQLRNDMFPKMGSYFGSKESTIQQWVDEAFDALSSLFSSKDEFVEYLNSLRNHKDAELLVRASQFYLISKKYQSESYFKLIMIISVIERLINRENRFQDFHAWVQKQDTKIQNLLLPADKVDLQKFKEIMDALSEEYFQVFGSGRNVLKFFQDYFVLADKIELAKSMKANLTDVVPAYSERMGGIKYIVKNPVSNIKELEKYGFKVSKSMMPYCYDWRKCYATHSGCESQLGCLLNEDENLTKMILKKVVGLMYQMRNDFVHSARVTPLNESKSIFTSGRVGKEPVFIELTANDLEAMFEKALKRYFDKLTT